ncbi:hypothetical protein GCM10009799_06030 [Nocardiopsis rhodophaea]|uniref:Siphovirus-type tail component C-terminal domain-containing protein n=1 Tax=Nocardiopsis rhodophaea TaxID=280238 RepID=A0ABN2SAV4_9ACTN
MAELTEGQIRWDGVLLFDGRRLALTGIEGWDDLPGIDSGNVLRPSRHGAWAGRGLAQQRVVTATGTLVAGDRGVRGVEPYVAAVRRATALPEDSEQRALTMRIGGQELTGYGQVTARSIPGGVGYQAGRPTVSIQWICPDPRRYGEERSTTIVAPARAEDGLRYPLRYPLDYGEPTTGGAGTVRNNGDTPAHPVLVFTGPCDRPRVVDQESGRVLEFDLVLAESDALVVDCGSGTVRLNGADRYYTLTSRSVPPGSWTVAPGRSTIRFRTVSSGPSASVRIRWRDAYL